MRSKEVQDALELLEKIRISESMNVYIGVKDVKKTKDLLKYISDLEKENTELRKRLDQIKVDMLRTNNY